MSKKTKAELIKLLESYDDASHLNWKGFTEGEVAVWERVRARAVVQLKEMGYE